MKFTETKLPGVFVVEPEKLEDERGYFMRGWCKSDFDAHGLSASFVQFNISNSWKAGTLRGLHYQIPPHQETKLIRCTKGALYDVIIDLRKTSTTYMQWLGVEISADSNKMLYVPGGLAHGFLTLEDNTEVFYPVSQSYHPSFERGVRWDDPIFGITWPEISHGLVISEKDKKWPNYSP